MAQKEARRDRPSEHAVTITLVVSAAAVTACVALARGGHYVAEWVVGLIAAAVAVVLFVGASVFTNRVFGVARGDDVDPYPEVPAAFWGSMSAEGRERTRQVRATDVAAARAWEAEAPAPETARIESDDGTRLVAHVTLANPGSRRWLLFAHDYRGTWGESAHHARRFAERGYNVLRPEMRGHGESGGLHVGLGLADRRDLVAWAKWLVRTYGGDVRIVVMGHSMGAAAALFACGEKDLPRQVVATVADCPFADAWSVLVAALRRRHVPPHPFADFVRSMLQRQLDGCDLVDVDVTAAVKRSRTPLLVIHGTADTVVAPEAAGRIVEAAGGKAEGKGKTLCLVEDAGHRLACWTNPDVYYDALFSFVKRHVK